MNYTRPMIELVYEIRRLAPPEVKSGIKLTNPELFHELIQFYHSDAKTSARMHIKELLHMAGNNWSKELMAYSGRPIAPPQEKTSPEVSTNKKQPERTAHSKKRIYRGQPVN